MNELEVLTFESQAAWRTWLEVNQAESSGVWLRFFKKGSGVAGLSYAEALDEALCYGWIDGQVKRGDERSYLQKFTPRRPRSIWSKRNIEHVARLSEEGKITEAGLKQVEAAKADGRWTQAYDPPSTMTVPEDFLAALAKNKKTKRFFDSLNKTNRYAIAWRLQTAKKPETRERRMKAILQMMAEGKKFH
jgi:uncharacterized protein YdeI (YjbR/CyaY-like superfamily)